MRTRWAKVLLAPKSSIRLGRYTFLFSGTGGEGVFILRPIVQCRRIKVGVVRPHQRFHFRINRGTAANPIQKMSVLGLERRLFRRSCARREEEIEVGFRQHALPSAAHHAGHDGIVQLEFSLLERHHLLLDAVAHENPHD